MSIQHLSAAGAVHAHEQQIYSAVQSALAASPVVASWRRCITMHRLEPGSSRPPRRIADRELRDYRDRSAQLIAAAADELDRLFATVGKAGCCVLMTDGDGIALERRGSIADDGDFRELGLWTGAVWSEASIGTNAIGTAIADERPVTIARGQHFFTANVDLNCTTAPIRDELGRIAGVLDISSCRADVTEGVLAILSQTVRDAALRIELNLFRAAFAGSRLVVVPGDTGSSAAMLAVDRNDIVLGATRAARLALKLDDRRIAAGVPACDLLPREHECEEETLEGAERAVLLRALSRTNGNISRAAIALGVSRATLHRKIARVAELMPESWTKSR